MALQIRRGLETNLPGSPEDGELLFATDTNRLYIGDGGTARAISQTRAGVQADLPASPANGEMFFTTDTGRLYVGNGGAHQLISQCKTGLVADLPASPADGQLFFATDTDTLYVGDGGSFQAISGGGGGGGVTDGGTLTDVTIGDVYYANNIISPIPVITETSYGDIETATPLVINGPLEVLSFDASNTAIATITDTFGYGSGGVNNSGYASANPYYPEFGIFCSLSINHGGGIQADALYQSFRVGDIMKCIGTNGVFTGTVTFTLTEILTNGPGDSTSYRNPGTAIFRGKAVADSTYTGPIAANIIQVYRPYVATSITGPLETDVIDSTQIVTDQLVVNESLRVVGQMELGAAVNNGLPGSYTVNASGNYAIEKADVSKTNLVSIVWGGGETSYSWTGFTELYMGLPPKTTDYLREISVLVQWGKSAQGIAFGSTQKVKFTNQNLDNTYEYDIPTVSYTHLTLPTKRIV